MVGVGVSFQSKLIAKTESESILFFRLEVGVAGNVSTPQLCMQAHIPNTYPNFYHLFAVTHSSIFLTNQIFSHQQPRDTVFNIVCTVICIRMNSAGCLPSSPPPTHTHAGRSNCAIPPKAGGCRDAPTGRARPGPARPGAVTGCGAPTVTGGRRAAATV